MKNSLIFILLLSFNYGFCQINEHFDDGDFILNPTWQGETGAFQINIDKQLQTAQSTTSQTVGLATTSNLAVNAKWEFLIKLSFDPSTSNRLRIYLVSDKSDLKGSLNGYFIQIGETGSADSYDLYRQNGITITKIINGSPKIRSSASQLIARIQISRDKNNLWELKTDNTGGNNFVTEGNVTDNTFISTSWFGVQCKFSATRSNKFFFDDFKIETLEEDKISPKLIAAKVLDTATIEAIFDEPIDSTSAKIFTNYYLSNGLGNPSKVTTTIDQTKFLLHLPANLNTGNYTLTVNGIKDFNGNTINDNNSYSFNYVAPYKVKPNDVVINEIFADPSPQIDLPTVEYIELWNTSEHIITLENWVYSDASSSYTFTKDSLQANEYVILCAKADTNEFKQYGRVIGISPWPSLNNSADLLTIKNEKGLTVNQVNYLDIWYKNASKKSGGWSLELIDPKAVCSGIQNWGSGKDSTGGTPGKQNSIYQSNISNEPLKLISASLTDSTTVLITFNRSLDSLSATNLSNYSINNSVGNPAIASPVSPNFDQVILKFLLPFVRGNNFQVTAINVTDCAGMVISPTNNSAEFIYTKLIAKGDILINEILFNPRPDGVDFVEIYNHSPNTLDLKDLFLATISKDTLSNLRQVSLTQLLLPSGQYLALSTNPENIKQEYQTENPNAFLKMASLPAFNDDGGTVILLSNNLRIDQLNYTEKMHFKLIKEPEGVSLERSSFSQAANNEGNFRSATASVGYATPGYKNSQFIDGISPDEAFSISSKTFSPDNDGFEDIMQINYKLSKPGLIANVTIYDGQGILIRKLIKNQSVEADGSFNWDGFNEFNERSSVGIYMIYAEFFDTNGQVKKYRKTCALGTKFN